MVTITDATRRINAIRECIAMAGRELTGWEIARLSIMWQKDLAREPAKMLYLLTGNVR